MKLPLGKTACLHLTDPSIGVIQCVNIEWHVRQEERHHPSRVIEVAVGDDNVSDLCEPEPGAVQPSREFKATTSIDQQWCTSVCRDDHACRRSRHMQWRARAKKGDLHLPYPSSVPLR